MRRFGTIVMCSLAALALAAAPEPKPLPEGLERDGVWAQNIDDARAIELSRETGRLALLHFTAEWCMPCKRMEATTYADDAVVDWLNAHTVALKVDVDEQPQVAQRFGVASMPTIVLVREGEVFDRTTGAKVADSFLGWLKGAREGKSMLDAYRERSAAFEKDERPRVNERYDFAEEMYYASAYDIALPHYLWLWDHIVEQPRDRYEDVVWNICADIEGLVEYHEPARAPLLERRDALTEIITGRGKKSMLHLDLWFAANGALDDDARTLEWYESVKDNPRHEEAIEYMQYELIELLVEGDRWGDVGDVLGNPLTSLRESASVIDMFDGMPGSPLDEMGADDARFMRQSFLEGFREEAAMGYAAMLASGEDRVAERVAKLAFDVDDSMEMRAALVERAIRAGAPNEHTRKIAEAMQERGEFTRRQMRQLDAAIAARESR